MAKIVVRHSAKRGLDLVERQVTKFGVRLASSLTALRHFP
jgi:hypothetical protein